MVQNAYECISLIWIEFPKELENCAIYDSVIELKNCFENKKRYFDGYTTKLVIIGNLSTGKSTLINTLLQKEYFGTLTGNTTQTFYYCSYTDKNYEYFTIDNGRELKDIGALKNASNLNVYFDDFINENSIIKVYVKDVNELLNHKTVIVDCPGLEHNEEYDKAIKKHCENADLFIFMFDVFHPATPMQKDYIRTIRNGFKNPTCFFVYNKCDLINFEENRMNELSKGFYELFDERFSRNFKINGDPLYFISSLNKLRSLLQHSNDQTESLNDQPDFQRLTQDIGVHKDLYFLRFENILAQLSGKIESFLKKLKDNIRLERNEKTNLMNENGELNVELNEFNVKCTEFITYVSNVSKDCANNCKMDKIFDAVRLEVFYNNETCTKETAYKMILKIADGMDSKIIDMLQSQLDKDCINVINAQLKDITENLRNFNLRTDIKLKMEKNNTFIPTDMNLNIFWFFERGTKTDEVKNAFVKFIETKKTKDQIVLSISKFYKDQLSEIEKLIKNMVENAKKHNLIYMNNLKQKIESKKKISQTLEEYEMKALECVRKYNSSLN